MKSIKTGRDVMVVLSVDKSGWKQYDISNFVGVRILNGKSSRSPTLIVIIIMSIASV